MKLGLVIPQGWVGEYEGWTSAHAWERSLEIAREAERLGFESVWAFDHLTTYGMPRRETLFESWMLLASIAQHTTKVRLGHLVSCAAFRNAALATKMATTLDVASGGRFDFGLGAGWKRDEFEAFGYPFPNAGHRLKGLEDALEVTTTMLKHPRASHNGIFHSVVDAICEPKATGPMPIIVGGNGPEVTWRLAARFANELNLDDFDPDDLRQALPVIRSRCTEIDRDPASLLISVHYFWPKAMARGAKRRETLSQYRQMDIHRVMMLLPDAVEDPAALSELAEDAEASGVQLHAGL